MISEINRLSGIFEKSKKRTSVTFVPRNEPNLPKNEE
jgi:hypothetical protein